MEKSRTNVLASMAGTLTCLARGILVVAALSGPALAQISTLSQSSKPRHVPEISLGALAGAVTIVASGTLILAGRFRRK